MDEAASVLERGAIACIPTDTIYGVVAKASDADAVERLYALRHRDPGKPMIVLLPEREALKVFGVAIDERLKDFLSRVWPGPVSVILDVASDDFRHIHRGRHTIAFRVPDDEELRMLLIRTGPLVAPSANLEGLPPAQSVKEARDYFGDSIDFYLDGGLRNGAPSTLVMYKDGLVRILRSGAGDTRI